MIARFHHDVNNTGVPMSFPIITPKGTFEIDIFFSKDDRITELCISVDSDGEGADHAAVDEEVCQMVITGANAMRKLARRAS